MLTIYGIPNCDTCRKARKWLDAQGTDYRWHDVREDGLSKALINDWQSRTDWLSLVNRRSTTWRGLDAAVRDELSAQSAVELLVANPTLLKRPVFDSGDILLVGFNEAAWKDALAVSS